MGRRTQLRQQRYSKYDARAELLDLLVEVEYAACRIE